MPNQEPNSDNMQVDDSLAAKVEAALITHGRLLDKTIDFKLIPCGTIIDEEQEVDYDSFPTNDEGSAFEINITKSLTEDIKNRAITTAKLACAVLHKQQKTKDLVQHIRANTIPEDIRKSIDVPKAWKDLVTGSVLKLQTDVLRAKTMHALEDLVDTFTRLNNQPKELYSVFKQIYSTSVTGSAAHLQVLHHILNSFKRFKATTIFQMYVRHVLDTITKFKATEIKHQIAKEEKKRKIAEKKQLSDVKLGGPATIGDLAALEKKLVKSRAPPKTSNTKTKPSKNAKPSPVRPKRSTANAKTGQSKVPAKKPNTGKPKRSGVGNGNGNKGKGKTRN